MQTKAQAVSMLTRLYIVLFGEPPRKEEVARWTPRLEKGSYLAARVVVTQQLIEEAFDAEAIRFNNWISMFYFNGCGRQPDPQGQEFWLMLPGPLAAKAVRFAASDEVAGYTRRQVNAVLEREGLEPPLIDL